MRLIGVIDLVNGRAVHARGGDRARYRPVASVAGRAIDGDPLTLARTYVQPLGLAELYVADLDAIRTSTAAWPPEHAARATSPLAVQPGHTRHDTLIAKLAAVAPVWLDAGIFAREQALHALGRGAATAIVGLETLDSFDTLAAICDTAGTHRVAFSLDVRDDAPVAPRMGADRLGPPERLAARAADAGVGSVIVLDLSRVGAATGPNLALVSRIRAAAPTVSLLVGGGVRGRDDLSRMADAGCDGALVATALHDGRLSPEDVRRYRHVSDSR